MRDDKCFFLNYLKKKCMYSLKNSINKINNNVAEESEMFIKMF